MPDVPSLQGPGGRRVALPGRFADAVTVVGPARSPRAPQRASGRRTANSTRPCCLAKTLPPCSRPARTQAGAPVPAEPEAMRLLVQSTRIRLAYDRQLAVSLFGIRTLPHQIEAVYLTMLPQLRLRLLLADDPGAQDDHSRPSRQRAQAPRGQPGRRRPQSHAVRARRQRRPCCASPDTAPIGTVPATRATAPKTSQASNSLRAQTSSREFPAPVGKQVSGACGLI